MKLNLNLAVIAGCIVVVACVFLMTDCSSNWAIYRTERMLNAERQHQESIDWYKQNGYVQHYSKWHGRIWVKPTETENSSRPAEPNEP